MISLDIIEKEISELEARGDTTYSLCERLATLYVVRDHLLGPKEDRFTRTLSGSEFLEAASDVPYDALMAIIDDHLEVLRVVQSREYNAVMDRIRAL